MSTAQAAGERAFWTWRRLRFVVVVAGIVALALGVLWALPGDLLDLGMRRVLSAIALVVAGTLILVWFLLFSGAGGSSRLATLLVVLAALGLAAASVRTVEFTGDMAPIIEFRWMPDRDDVLERHRANNAPLVNDQVVEIALGPRDVLEYRGAKRDGIMGEPYISPDWDARPPRLAWRQPIGGGYAAFVVAGPLAITIEQRRDKEAVVAYDAESGVQRWVYSYPARFSEKLGGDGPRATPTVAQNRVFALGATGVLSCLDLATGSPRWSKDILHENHCGNLEWGMAGSPLVSNDVVVVNPGTQSGTSDSRAVLGYAVADGHLEFAVGAGKASYASPMLADIAGRRQILIFDAGGLAGFDASGGELWRAAWTSDFDINAAQPIVLPPNRVLISSNAGSALLEIALNDGAFSVSTLWKNRNLKCNYACPIALGGFVYGLDESILACLDLKTGQRRWKGGRYGHGQMLASGDLLIIMAETGELALVRATPEKFEELGRMQAIEGRTWNNPALREGRLFIRNHLEMAAYDLPLLVHSVFEPDSRHENGAGPWPPTSPPNTSKPRSNTDAQAPPKKS